MKPIERRDKKTMPNFLDILKTNILSPLEKGVQGVGKTLGDIFKPIGTATSDLFKPIASLKPEQSEYAIKTSQGEYKPYTNLWVETAAQTFGIDARETDFWERLPHAYYGAVFGMGAGLAKAFTFGWWNPELKFENDAAQMASNMTKVEGDIIGTIGTFLVGGAVVKGVGMGIPAVVRFAKIAPKTYSLLTSGLTFAGLGQLQKDEFEKDAKQRATDFGADFALGGVFSIAGMKPSYFKSTGIIAPAAYVASLIKGDSPEDALKNTIAVIGLHSVNYAVAKAFPSQAAQIQKNMEKAAEEQLGVTKAQAREYLGVTEKTTPEQVKIAWKQKVVEIVKTYPAQAEQTPQEFARFNQEWNTTNRVYEFLTKVKNPTGYTGKSFRQEFEDLFRELWVNVPDKRALVVSAVRNMPAGLSIRPTLTDEQRTEVIKGLGGEEVKTKFGLAAGKLSNSDLITLAKEQNIQVTPSKGTPEQAITEAAKAPEAAKPTVERTEIWNVPGDLMPARGKPTWKHSKMLWNTMRNQYGMSNTWSKDITKNKGAVSWIIDTLENGLASTKDLMTEARKTRGVRMDRYQYKKLYAMFKSHDYDIEGYKKVMATLKGLKPAVIERTIEPPAPATAKAPAFKLKTAEELIKENRLRPQTSGFGKGKFWQYIDEKGFYTVAPTKEEAVKRANEALVTKPAEPQAKTLPIRQLIDIEGDSIKETGNKIPEGEIPYTKGAIDVVKTSDGYIVLDGQHRASEALKAGKENIEVNVLSPGKAVEKYGERWSQLEGILAEAKPPEVKPPPAPGEVKLVDEQTALNTARQGTGKFLGGEVYEQDLGTLGKRQVLVQGVDEQGNIQGWYLPRSDEAKLLGQTQGYLSPAIFKPTELQLTNTPTSQIKTAVNFLFGKKPAAQIEPKEGTETEATIKDFQERVEQHRAEAKKLEKFGDMEAADRSAHLARADALEEAAEALQKTIPKPVKQTEVKPTEEPITLYHGTTPENAAMIQKTGFEVKPPVHGRQVIGEGVYLTPTKEEAATFGKQIIETTLKPGVKILKLNNPGEYHQLWQKVAKEAGAFGAKEVNMDKAMSDWLKVRGYGGIEVKGFGAKGETYISVFDPKNIEVKTTKAPAKEAKPQPGKVSPQVEQLQLKKDALEKLRYANPGDVKIVNAIKKIDDQIAQQFTAQEQKAAQAEEIRLKYSPEEKELLEAERVPSVGEILKSKKFQERIAGKVKAPNQMRLDEAKPAPPGSPPRPPKEEPIAQAPPPPEGSGLEAIDKMVGKIGAPQKMGEFLKGFKPWFSRNFTDRFAAMKAFEENISKLQGQPIDINSSPYVAARLYAGRFGTIEAAFRDLQKVVTPVRKDRADFTRYVLAQRAIERADRGFDNPAGVTKEQAELALTELKAKNGDKVYKQFEQAGAAIQNWSIREILEPMRDTGLISKKAFNAIVEKNKSWMPFHVLDYLPDVHQVDKMQSGSETFSVSKQGVIQGLKGTEKIIRDPFESIVDNLSKAISLTKRNEVARKFIDLRKSHPEAKESIKYLFKDAKAPRDWDTISAFINGKVTRWAVPKELSDAMHSLSPAETSILGKLAVASTRAFKAGVTTFYIPFTLTNAIRDYQTATIVNKWGFNPVNWLSGFKDGIKGAFKWESKAYDDFLRNEGGYGGYIGSTRQLSIAAKELFTPSWWTKTKAVINPFNLISNFAEAIELSPRLGIYKKGIKKPGVTELEAAFEARNSTVDFAKAGKEMRIINQWIPFVNARWQGLLRVKDAFKEHPFKSALKAMAMIVLPGVATYFYNILNHEELWDDIPQWAKDNYFIIILGSELDEEGKTVPKVLQIPKGDMGQIFFNPLMYAFEYVREQEPANLLKLAVEWTSQLSPIPFARDGELSGSAFLAGALPPALKTLVEEVTNTNLFTGFPLIPRKLEKVAPTEQYNEKTAPLAVALGRAVGASPMRIAHVASGLFGSSSRYVFNPGDLLGASVERFVRTQGGAKEQEAWNIRDEAEVGYNTTRIFVQRALQAGDLQQAQNLATAWNAKVQQYIPKIVPYLMADDPKEAVSFQKSIMFDAADLQRLMKLNAPQGKPGSTLKPPAPAVGAPSTQNDPLGLLGGGSAAPATQQPTMGQIFPTQKAGGGNDPLGLFK